MPKVDEWSNPDILKDYGECTSEELASLGILCPIDMDEETKKIILEQWKNIVMFNKRGALDAHRLLLVHAGYVMIEREDKREVFHTIVPNATGELKELSALTIDENKMNQDVQKVYIEAPLARFKFSGYGALDIHISADEAFQFIIVKETEENGRKKGTYIGKYTSDVNNVSEIVLGDPEYSMGFNNYVATVVTNSGNTTNYKFRVAEHVDFEKSEHGGVWFSGINPVSTLWETKMLGAPIVMHDTDVVLARWFIESSDCDRVYRMIQGIINALRNKSSFLDGVVKKGFSIPNLASFVLTAPVDFLLNGVKHGTPIGYGLGVIITVLCSIFIGDWENQIITQLEAVNYGIDTILREKIDCNIDKPPGIMVEIGYKQRVKLNSFTRLGEEKKYADFKVSKWQPEKNGNYMYGPTGFYSSKYGNKKRWYIAGPYSGCGDRFEDLEKIVEAIMSVED
ncbi:hypothetical protein [Butyrivibrio proteoclasticus]|uniref:hypothetical protein n=1 Tax=Butyrivibrio proteoclasticus TaxID=43305 RepID=UPI0004787F28|nr:hypothetical protein [Butyrivibrio proteoclasticus]